MPRLWWQNDTVRWGVSICHSVFTARHRFLHPEIDSNASCLVLKLEVGCGDTEGCVSASTRASMVHGVLSSFGVIAALGFWLGCWWRGSWSFCLAPSDSPGSSGWGIAKGWVWTPFSYTLFTVQAVWGWGRLPQSGGGGAESPSLRVHLGLGDHVAVCCWGNRTLGGDRSTYCWHRIWPWVYVVLW